jgi:predicted DNA-binding protein YlxM (UPF0122 family)
MNKSIFMFLSNRQLEILSLFVRGMNSKEIAQHEGMHRHSVQRVLKECYEILIGFDSDFDGERLRDFCNGHNFTEVAA